jgi:phosphoenolpyruvate carboxykinase (ATP)
MLRNKMNQHKSTVWLVNTGWTGGAYGAGSRMTIKHTRAILTAALSGKLDNVPYIDDPIFGVAVPQECPDVPSDILIPKNAWKDKSAYEQTAKKLAGLFAKNFQKYADKASDDVIKAGPKG